jgi:hypothetical protein
MDTTLHLNHAFSVEQRVVRLREQMEKYHARMATSQNMRAESDALQASIDYQSQKWQKSDVSLSAEPELKHRCSS